MATLSESAVAAVLAAHAGWRLEAGMFVRDYEFPDFAAAMVFVNAVAGLAEEANHHPDVDIRYNKVRLALISHDAGGLTKRDAAFVERLGAL